MEILELWSTITKVKYSSNGLGIRFKLAKDQISELDNRLLENFQS